MSRLTPMGPTTVWTVTGISPDSDQPCHVRSLLRTCVNPSPTPCVKFGGSLKRPVTQFLSLFPHVPAAKCSCCWPGRPTHSPTIAPLDVGVIPRLQGSESFSRRRQILSHVERSRSTGAPPRITTAMGFIRGFHTQPLSDSSRCPPETASGYMESAEFGDSNEAHTPRDEPTPNSHPRYESLRP